MEYEEMKQIVANQVCAQCGGELTIHSNVDTRKVEVWCPSNPDHHGYVERETYTQEFRRKQQNLRHDIVSKTLSHPGCNSPRGGL